MTTAGIFDNLRFAVQIHGQKELSLIEQFFTERKQFRITNARGTPEYIEVNDGLPQNDIVRSKADFIISDADWRASVRQAQTEELFALLQQLAPVAPQVALVMLDLIVEGMDVTSRDEIVKRIRQVTGMRDPDAEDMTPEEKQQEAAKQQAEQAQAELNQRAIMAKIAVDEARAQKDMASIGKTQADVKKVLGSLAGENVQTQLAALQAAIAAIQTPGAVGVADGILHESGFTSRTEEDAATQAAVEEAQQQQEQAQQEQAAQQQQQQQEQEQAGQQQAGQEQQQPEPQGAGLSQFA